MLSIMVRSYIALGNISKIHAKRINNGRDSLAHSKDLRVFVVSMREKSRLRLESTKVAFRRNSDASSRCDRKQDM